MTSIRNKYKKLALALASVAFALISAEVLLQLAVGLGVLDVNAIRSFNPSTDSKEGAGLYYVHPYTSYAMKPGYRRGDRTVNSLGFRGTEVKRRKSSGRLSDRGPWWFHDVRRLPRR